MKVNGWAPAQVAPPAAAQPQSQERGRFQHLLRRLEHDMWSGADAGHLLARTASAARAHAPRGETAPTPAAAKAAAAPSLPGADATIAASQAFAASAMRLADRTELPAPPAAAKGKGDAAASFAIFVAPAATARVFNGRLAYEGGEAGPHRSSASPSSIAVETQDPSADRIQLMNGATGLSIGVRLHEDRPLDHQLLRRVIARVLAEHRAGPASLYVNGNHQSIFEVGERHGD